MKKWLLVLLGLFLAGMAVTAIATGDPFGIAFGIAFAAGAVAAFRAAGRAAPRRPGQDIDNERPWQH